MRSSVNQSPMNSIFINCRHSDEMIDRLERAGLGYHVNTDETDDKLGNSKH